jgi:hypothetical protein
MPSRGIINFDEIYLENARDKVSGCGEGESKQEINKKFLG